MPLLFAYGKNRFPHDVAHLECRAKLFVHLEAWADEDIRSQ